MTWRARIEAEHLKEIPTTDRRRRNSNLTMAKRLTENELSDFSRLWHDGCGKAIIEAQDVDRNHSSEV
jgi:hypothetical protein